MTSHDSPVDESHMTSASSAPTRRWPSYEYRPLEIHHPPHLIPIPQLYEYLTDYIQHSRPRSASNRSQGACLDHVVGTGGFADVYAGTFHGNTVAIKKLHTKSVTVTQLQSFIAEILLMSTFDSPYIVKLVGASWTQPIDIKCVMEYMDGGDLRHYLQAHNAVALTWADKLGHIAELAKALVYLHSMKIIHRDLKSHNILLDSTKGTKLTDLGITRKTWRRQ
ncbi:Aste57867_19091 [Aphanomyces stellatus]|uniref:Aste57867_19091 protein n=1 Tax=Aphanomyces stellatus TaxID=120398 RepID=A0A485LCD4_9STRA|nr:hypothetical protein As57867_019027 [Aphanomyces stellatus]VFT95816.1 Aste57867_19091 [Aphanomyces stellatus]